MKNDLNIASLRKRYLAGELHPLAVMEDILARIGDDPHRVWIHRLSLASIAKYVAALQDKDPATLPLYGIPFAIKDNIDLAGAPTTAGCPEFAYQPQQHATVVQRLIDAGAIPVGKTNLDQFATGLNGTRSPHGACRNAYDADYISGGSSSGSAVAVALGHVQFQSGYRYRWFGSDTCRFQQSGRRETHAWLGFPHAAWCRPVVRWIAFPSLRSTQWMPTVCCQWQPDTMNRMLTRVGCWRMVLILDLPSLSGLAFHEPINCSSSVISKLLYCSSAVANRYAPSAAHKSRLISPRS